MSIGDRVGEYVRGRLSLRQSIGVAVRVVERVEPIPGRIDGQRAVGAGDAGADMAGRGSTGIAARHARHGQDIVGIGIAVVRKHVAGGRGLAREDRVARAHTGFDDLTGVDIGGGDRRIVYAGDLHRGGGPAERAVAETNRIGETVGECLALSQLIDPGESGRTQSGRVVSDLAIRRDPDSGAQLAVVDCSDGILLQQVARGTAVGTAILVAAVVERVQ